MLREHTQNKDWLHHRGLQTICSLLQKITGELNRPTGTHNHQHIKLFVLTQRQFSSITSGICIHFRSQATELQQSTAVRMWDFPWIPLKVEQSKTSSDIQIPWFLKHQSHRVHVDWEVPEKRWRTHSARHLWDGRCALMRQLCLGFTATRSDMSNTNKLTGIRSYHRTKTRNTVSCYVYIRLNFSSD